jgi:hypothetical protein
MRKPFFSKSTASSEEILPSLESVAQSNKAEAAVPIVVTPATTFNTAKRCSFTRQPSLLAITNVANTKES